MRKTKQNKNNYLESRIDEIRKYSEQGLFLKDCAVILAVKRMELIEFCVGKEIYFGRKKAQYLNKNPLIPTKPLMPTIGDKILGGVVVYVHHKHDYFVIKKRNYCTSISVYDFKEEVAN